MTGLARLQRGFQRNIVDADPRFEREVVSTSRAPAARRLAIYSGAYAARLIEALGKDYPALRALAREPRFERVAREYIAAHPSPFSNLRWYGGELAAFLARIARSPRGAALAEMAAFEWQLGLAFDAADATPITINDIARVGPEEWPGMRFTPHPSVRRLALHYNVPALRAAAEKGKSLPRLKRAKGAVAWLVWRQDLVARYRSLAPDEAHALDALLRGAPFGEICAHLAGAADPGLHAAQLLKGWLAEGLLCGIELVMSTGDD